MDHSNLAAAAASTALFHGKLSNLQRRAIWERFIKGQVKHLITTDLASRGLDTTNVSHIILFDLPNNMADFMHRIGRTGRPTTSSSIDNSGVDCDDSKVYTTAMQGAHKTLNRGTVYCLITDRDEPKARQIRKALLMNSTNTNSRQPR